MPRRSQTRSSTYSPPARSGAKYYNGGSRPMSPTAPTKSRDYLKQAGAVAGGVVAGNLISAALLTPRVVVMRDAAGNPIDPCAKEVKNLLDCAQNVPDLSYCEGLKKALIACREKYEGRAPE